MRVALALLCALAGSPAFADQFIAATAGLAVSKAALAGGQLVVVGSSAPRVRVRILRSSASTFADAKGAFSFHVLFRTDDCRITLATNSTYLTVLVADCGP